MKNKETFSPEEGSTIVEKKGIGWKAGLIIIIVGLVLLTAMYFGFSAVTAKPSVQPVQINGYFIDVNGDGKLDYVVSSEVILNSGQLNLTPSP